MRTFRTRAAVLAVAGALALTACGGGDSTDGGDTGDGDAVTAITITGTDDLKFDVTSFAVPAGEEVSITLVSGAAVAHNVVIEELDDLVVVEADAGVTATGTVTLEAGTYTYYCNIPGHRQAGMEGTITSS